MIKFPDDINLKNWFNSVEAGDDVDWEEPKYLSPEWHEWLHRHQLALGAWQFAIAEVQRLNATAQPVTLDKETALALIAQLKVEHNIDNHTLGSMCAMLRVPLGNK